MTSQTTSRSETQLTFTLTAGDPLKAPRREAIIIDLRDLDTDRDGELLELLEHYGVDCNFDSGELYDYSAVLIERDRDAYASALDRAIGAYPTALTLDAREILSNNQLLEDALCW